MRKTNKRQQGKSNTKQREKPAKEHRKSRNDKLLEDVAFVIGVCSIYLEDPTTSMKELAKDLGITKQLITDCIYAASTKNWITYQMVCDIKAKEHFMQSRYYPKAITDSDRYFDEKIFPERRKNIRESLSKEFCMEVVRIYIDNPSNKKVHELCGLSQLEMNDVIIKGAILGFIPDGEFKKICEILEQKRGSIPKLVITIQEYRERYATLFCIYREKDRQFHSYDHVYSDADDAPSKEDIEAERDRAKDEMETIRFFIETWHD
jgi:hypothetical protein